MKKKIVIALGGNAILRPGQIGTFEVQMKNVIECSQHICNIVKEGHQVIITHGNGPQVGNILTQNEMATEKVPEMPLFICNAQSQGLIGYMFEQALKNELIKQELQNSVVTLLTQTEVDSDDVAFATPTKPIGGFYTESQAKELIASEGYCMVEDSGRGYRRAVASPQPINIHGVEQIKKLLLDDVIVISSGGGGIPVTRDKDTNMLKGIDAVIDKDRSALKLATQVDADVLMILTDVSNVFVNYNTPNQKKLETIDYKVAQAYMDEGQFADGSMGPKMEAAIEFAMSNKESIICSIADAAESILGDKGTRII